MYAKHRNYYVYSLYNIFLGSNKENIFYKRIKQNNTVYTYVYVLHYSSIENNFLNHAWLARYILMNMHEMKYAWNYFKHA